MANHTSQHILATASNLLGFCLFVITSMHITNTADTSIIDEFTSVIALCLACSCFCSFISIKAKRENVEQGFERLADILFIASLAGILLIILLLVFKLIK